MENLIFSLNATAPIFALMVLGYLFRRISLIDEKSAGWMNKFVFKVALPVLVFKDLASQDFAGTWNGKFVLFCFIVTSVSIAVIALFSKLVVKDRCKRGEFIQASYRSSAALLGIAFIHNIYGDAASGRTISPSGCDRRWPIGFRWICCMETNACLRSSARRVVERRTGLTQRRKLINHPRIKEPFSKKHSLE